MKQILLTLSLTLIYCAFSFAQSKFDQGLKAFDAKDYETSFNTLKPYAEQGNCLAQYVIGFSYQYGLSVTRNDSVARHWLQLAAEQKQVNAMGPLAVNLMGAGEDDSLIKAYLWAMLAAEYLPSQRATSARYVIKSHLKPEQLETGMKLIEDYKQKWKHQENCH
ncbi:sel1 repeat family protein [Mucilaginibacter sp. JRF]|uniref:sel1 repeat family protein n=1 Tax=Mucilaginibacter sp. JRF TaxID=2780088 RepID=UPI00187FE411|nr:sel1 repeat family protein [Mucilaginibacter sp. JRF]MBE9586835.1 sel1 repeat family protein [Mucilaginibacter sp. JRF]